MAEIAFETIRLALEATRGTAITTPTHLLNLEGTLTPGITRARPREQRGTTFKNYRHVDTRKMSTFEGEGELDVNEIAVLLNMCVAPLTTPSTPPSGLLTRLWEFVRSGTADNLKSSTVWWGDPAINQQRSAFVMLDELVIENDASSEDLATLSVKGMGKFPAKVAAPGATSSIAGATFPGQLMQCWIDSASVIGTTEITDRLVSAKHTIKTGIKYKYVAKGPTSDLSHSLVGLEKVSHVETELTFEFLDYTQYDLWAAGTDLKTRVRHNGALIESVTGPLDYYNYVEIDTYAPGDELEWSDNEGTNRTVTLKFVSQYDATLGSDLRVAVQNQRTTL